MGKLYIAYGSNLNLAQMAARCPSASIYAAGLLNNWELVYGGHKANSHATIIRKQGSTVPVLVWEIQPADEYRLDIYEGYPHYYFKKYIMVSIAGQKKESYGLYHGRKTTPGRPSALYIKTILQGYVDNNMDISILKKSLEVNSIECT